MTQSADGDSSDFEYSFQTVIEFQPLDINPLILTEKEKAEGVDPFKIIKQIDEQFGTTEGWDLRKQNDEISVWTKWSGTDERSDIGLLRATHHFPQVNEPSKILKAINDERPLWNDAYELIENIAEFDTKNCRV